MAARSKLLLYQTTEPAQDGNIASHKLYKITDCGRGSRANLPLFPLWFGLPYFLSNLWYLQGTCNTHIRRIK